MRIFLTIIKTDVREEGITFKQIRGEENG